MSVKLNLTASQLMLLLCLLLTVTVPRTECACTFPSHLTGSWVRSRDSLTLTFTSNTVSGLNVLFNGVSLGDMTCDTLSSGRYIIATAEYTGTLAQQIYYMCWQFVSVSDNAFLLYELSDDVNIANYAVRPGSIQTASSSLSVSSACPQSTSTTLFTTLVKSGSSSSSVAATCPSAVLASFTYGSCTSATLSSCSDNKVLTADYGSCSDTVFGSAGGSVSCMGSAVYQGDRYISLYKHDAGNDIICWKIPDTSSPGSMSTTFYSDDCSSLSGATTLDLTLGEECASSDSSGGGGGGGDGAVIGGAVGGALVAIAAVGVLGFLFIRKKQQQNVVGDAESANATKPSKGDDSKEPIDPSDPKKSLDSKEFGDPTAPEDSKIPEDTPRVPNGLPPLEHNGGSANGEALRG